MRVRLSELSWGDGLAKPIVSSCGGAALLSFLRGNVNRSPYSSRLSGVIDIVMVGCVGLGVGDRLASEDPESKDAARGLAFGGESVSLMLAFSDDGNDFRGDEAGFRLFEGVK